MGDSSHHQPPPSKMRLRNSGGGGQIVEVQGGHIVRSTGRKDRHSKVCTAKGPRDRRVRLAAHTAIQFYDVQDRLGYDRPSKAVDWLINKAKTAIDDLAQLPPWHPLQDEERRRQQHQSGFDKENHENLDDQNSSFLPPSLDSDAIADTIKSFFPTSAEASSSAMQQFQSFPTPDQDLRLSLHSLQDPILLQNQQSQSQPQSHQNPTHLSGGFDGWPPPSWNGGDGGGAGYLFNVPPPPMLQQLLSQNQFLSQRGPLQSSNTPSFRAWMDPSAIAIAAADHHHHHHHPPQALPIHPSSMFASGFGGFSGFNIPARIQGDEEEHEGYSDKPSSASSDSRH